MDQSTQNPKIETQKTRAETPRASLNKWLLTIVGALFSLFLIYLILFSANQGASVYENILVTVLVGFFPISYLAFEVRAGQHKDRLVSRINILGFADKREQNLWENLYRQLNPPQEYILFVSLVVLISLFGFGLLRFSVSDLSSWGSIITNTFLQTMFYSFLGAYIFAIYNVSRRYVTYDMSPGVYLQSAVLMVTVIAIGYIASFYLYQEGGNPLVPSPLIPIVAFLIGYIPESGIRFLKTITSRFVDMDRRRELNLGDVNGISIWHETRLRESGVDNVQNLAAMDIRQLLLTSRYSMPQVIHWVDQAILLSTLPKESIERLQEIGINTMTALLQMVASVPRADPEQIKLVPIDKDAELTHDELVMLATLARSVEEPSPNLAYVQGYWQAIRQVETEQMRVQTQNLLADITRQAAAPIFANDQSLDLLTSLVSETDLTPEALTGAFARDANSAVGLANAYIENSKYAEAIGILDRTIEQFHDQSGDLSPAYASLGLAHGMQAISKTPKDSEYTKLVEKSDKDFKDATQVDPDYPVTYIYRGALLHQRKEFEAALSELNEAIRIGPTIPKAYLTRGKIYSNLNQYDLAIDDFTEAIKLARALESQRILKDAYYERATLYLNSSKLDDAKSDFDEEILLDSQNPLAYLGRGKTLLLRGSKTLELSGTISYAVSFPLSRAISDFETAIDLYKRQQKDRRQDHPDPNTAIAYSNIAQAYFQLEQYFDAVANIQKAFDLGDQSLINFKVRGLSYIKIGELKSALGDLTYYLSKLPDNSPEQSVLQVIIEQIQKKLNSQASPTPPPDSPPAG
jgi:tetratricopeptide (TPR) repeat protein